MASARRGSLGWRRAWLVLVVMAALALGRDAGAQGSISVQATDLTDTTLGQDLWRFTYFVSGFEFQTNQGFSIFFDFHNYTDLHNPMPDSSFSWSTLAVQPDLLLHADGYFDAQALVNLPATSDTFSVDFIWLGTGVPGEQSYYTYDSNYQPLVFGTTVVPEPGPGMFAWLGVATTIFWRTLRTRAKK